MLAGNTEQWRHHWKWIIGDTWHILEQAREHHSYSTFYKQTKVWKATPNINILNKCGNDISQVCVKQANMIYKDQTLNGDDYIYNAGEVEEE